ncbi:hypothetical protein B2J93_6588 [Marssonina coronariae]|uniref:Cwf15/Cwc15 cell cycle control protein n=1 Tax=Diplocarpon coronariae TaxID=2795749 RepID=A0A218YZN2_9HELO|nr:hypothetical protein B2J93_6588 [Marssonina coronariae]
MTTAHRPTFDPARGKDAQRGPAYHQRLLPAHTQLKVRQPGQGGDANREVRDLRAELLQAEAAHFAKVKGGPAPVIEEKRVEAGGEKRQLEEGEGEEDPEAKRRRILEETRDIDADSEEDEEDSSDDDRSSSGFLAKNLKLERRLRQFKQDPSTACPCMIHQSRPKLTRYSDDEDETAELQRELEKIKRERAEKREQEACRPNKLQAQAEREKAAEEEALREHDIALGNPLLNPKADFNVKRRWDDDVIFKNQARGTEDKGKKKEFVNDLLRSDFHKRFMSKYVR